MTMSNVRRQGGMTLIELMLVLGLGMAIVIGGLIWYNSVKEAQRLGDGVRNLQSMTSAVRAMFAPQGNYDGLTEAVAMRASGFPAQMRTGTDGQMGHPWDESTNAVVIAVDSMNAPNDAFLVTWNNLPEAACTNLAAQTYTSYERLTIGGGNNRVTGIAQIATGCSGDSNSLTWRVR
ncbi:type II secretory pathway pseudopilin PulG [Natronocella acetinitrilica]|uniref:Type II secretory pathway pseudopilin PulG n=1 Tax=Natronocella acetinitrilica TaxID=414046 RepID=A0AAE3G4J7_9GAMM|nr:type 4 pilus major pilin [Natronocella acetinitrilica]MCP1674263.1 type II secretory pathway pseudopilin PulG [Natronocella acetinitrilica]